MGTRLRIAIKVWFCAATLSLYGCGGSAKDTDTSQTSISTEPIASRLYAGEVNFRISESFQTKDGQDLPFELYLGFEPKTESRIGVNALMDLRGFQRALPEALTGTVDPDCGLGLDIDLDRVLAEGDMVRAAGSVKTSLFRCSKKGTEDESRGMRLLSQTIEVEALASASLEGECVSFHLADLKLDPSGLLGGLANLFGITERARRAILEEAARVFAESPVCPELPDVLDILETHFEQGGLREIETAGLGASLTGSLNLAAPNLVQLLKLTQQEGIGPGRSAFFQGAGGGPSVSYRIDEALPVGDQEFPYGLDLHLSPASNTRLGARALLDLRELQDQLPELLSDTVVMDNCGARITLRGIEVTAEGANIVATGPLEMESFDCKRINPGTWERGPLESTEQGDLRFEMSAELVEQCVVFRLIDVARDTPFPFAEVETEGGRTQAAKALLIEAVGLLLEERPFCPEYPEGIDLLDPHFTRGTPEEIGEGGVGVALDGSVDLSSRTLIEILALLQKQNMLPPAE